MKDITLFVQEQLYPVTFNYINSIFPELDFKQVRGKWLSPLNIDGSKPQHPRPDKTVITPRIPTRAIENGGGGSKDLIDLYKSLNGCSTYEAIKAMAEAVGVQLPTDSLEDSDRWRAYKEKQDALELSLSRQKVALYSTEGAQTLSYLHSRGWTDEQIQEAELGYISRAEADAIGAQKGIGEDYILSIPLRSSGRLYGFKFRYISEECNAAKQKKGKYRYLEGTKASQQLYGLTGIQQTNGEIVVVEGELDALHAQVMGISNIVATSGGALTDELIQAAKKKGISFITLLLDADKAGEDFIRRSIKAAYRADLTCFVAVLSDGSKDVDEFLSKHPIEELKNIIGNASTSSLYLYGKLLEDYVQNKQGGEGATGATEKDYIRLRDDVINLALDTPDHEQRDRILANFSEQTGGVISEYTLKEKAELRQAEADREKQSRQTAEAIRMADRLQKNGNTLEAIKSMGEAFQSLSAMDKRAKYSHLLTLPTRENLSNRIKNKQDSIETSYEFKSPTGEKELFTLPSGAITFICAPTSHGKSTMLQNLALQVATNQAEGDTLYFTFEEDGDSVLLQMINKYANMELCRNYNQNRSNNLRAITHKWRTGSNEFIKTELRAPYQQKEDEFLSTYIESGRLRIFYEDYDSTELIEAIEAIGKERKIKAVFIDYIQLLNKRGNKLQRTEELKDICKDFKNMAIRNQLPIIVAAQLNREAKSPIEMHSQNIAEAADLERIANKVLCLWNTSFTSQRSGEIKKELEEFQKRTNITLGEAGKIYAKLTKNRGGIVGIEAVLTYTGNTGKIEPIAEASVCFGKPQYK